MANAKHLKILQQGVEVWNKWREENWDVRPDLSESDFFEADLSGANFADTNLSKVEFSMANLSSADFSDAVLSDANLFGANLYGADFPRAYLWGVDLSGADLSWAYLHEAQLAGVVLVGANLSKADFSGADLSGANLYKADLSQANLSDVNLHTANLCEGNFYKVKFSGARLIQTDLSNASIENANIYGISAWDIKKDGLIQKDLIITPYGEPEITVDDLEVAQFIYLMLNNQNIRNVIETITSKAVLILGRFTEERKKVLDALKDELRLRNYLPIVFDFDKPSRRDIDETVNLLARMSRFVVADVTDAKSIPQELKGFVAENPSIPVVPLILKGQSEYGMFDHFRRYHWMLPLHEYASPDELLANIVSAIIAPAEQKVEELRSKG